MIVWKEEKARRMGSLFSCFFSRSDKKRVKGNTSVHLADVDNSGSEQSSVMDDGLANYVSPPRSEVKLLLLGPSESGKSTIVKQMKLLLQATGRSAFKGFTQEEKRTYRRTIYSNAITGMKTIMKAMVKLGLTFSDPARKQDYRLFSVLSQRLNEGELSSELAVVMQRLWTDASVQECLKRSNEYDLNDSAPYFLNHLERITRPGYLPTDEDVLKARVKKFEPTEVILVQDNYRFRIIDFGDQESERKKWVQCFSTADAIVFCASLADYDTLDHDGSPKNKLKKSMDYFASICNNKFFNYTTIFLMLNKSDVFRAKLAKCPLSLAFSSYKGENSFEETVAFISQKFEKLNHRERRVHTLVTCATNTGDVRQVWDRLVGHIQEEGVKKEGDDR